MGSEVIFDTLQYAKKLKAAGVPAKQAEVHAEAMAELVDNKLATKQDLKELELRLKELELRIELRLKELELRMTIKLGSMVIGSMSILVILLKLFKL